LVPWWFPSLLSLVPLGAWSCSLSRSLGSSRGRLGVGSSGVVGYRLRFLAAATSSAQLTVGAAVVSSPSSVGVLRRPPCSPGVSPSPLSRGWAGALRGRAWVAAASVSLSGLVWRWRPPSLSVDVSLFAPVFWRWPVLLRIGASLLGPARGWGMCRVRLMVGAATFLFLFSVLLRYPLPRPRSCASPPPLLRAREASRARSGVDNAAVSCSLWLSVLRAILFPSGSLCVSIASAWSSRGLALSADVGGHGLAASPVVPVPLVP
jgi:hypothetical protein